MPDPRHRVIARIRDTLARDERVTGLILLGSGATGFRDQWSDVDLMAVVTTTSDPLEVGDDAVASLCRELPVRWYLQTTASRALGLQSLLLDDHLEVDLSFRSLEHVIAIEDRWRVLLDRTGEVEKRMRAEIPPVDTVERARSHYIGACAGLYFGLKASQRGEPLHAASRVSELRAGLTALWCLEEFGTDHLATSRADSLPDDQRAQLAALCRTDGASAVRVALSEGLRALTAFDHDRLRELGIGEYAGLATWLASPDDHTT